MNLAMSRGRATTNQTFFAGESNTSFKPLHKLAKGQGLGSQSHVNCPLTGVPYSQTESGWHLSCPKLMHPRPREDGTVHLHCYATDPDDVPPQNQSP